MSGWLIKVTAIKIVTSCAELLLPDGKTKNSCKTVLSLVCLAVLIEPLAHFSNFEFDFSKVFNDNSYNDEFVDTTNDYYSSLCENEIRKTLEEKGVVCEKCEVVGKIEKGKFNFEKIAVKIKNSVISGKDEHIISNVEIQKLLANLLSVSEDMVFVYE